MKKIFILIIAIITQCQCLFDNSKIIKQISTYAEYENIRNGNSDHLSFLFFYEEDCQKCIYFESMIDDISKALNGIVSFYGVNCELIRNDEKVIDICELKNNEYLPQIFLYEPPQYNYNPYTKEKMPAIEHGYQGQAKVDALKDFTKKYIPAFRAQLKSLKDVEEFFQSIDLPNKLILFTDKSETPLMFKGMTSIFRDRLAFAEIHKENEDLIKKYKIEQFPTLLMFTYDKSTKKFQQETYSGKITFDNVKQYLQNFALDYKITKKSQIPTTTEEQNTISQEFQIKKYQKSILQQEKMVLMYIYKPGEIDPENNENSWSQIMKLFGEMIVYFKFELDSEEKEQFAEEQLFIKTTPIFKFFPIGIKKKAKSKIFFSDEISLEKFKKEISEILDNNSRGISTLKELQLQTIDTMKENKIPIIMLIKGSQATISYRAITYLTQYTNNFNFYTIQNPQREIMEALGLSKLPQLIALTKSKEDGDYLHLMFKGNFIFSQFITFLDQIAENHLDQTKKQATIAEILHLQSQTDFEQNCLLKSSHCFIAFLNPQQQNSKHETQIELLEDLQDKFADKNIEFMWIDGICHRYLLERINLNEDDLPYSNQVGTFSFDSLSMFIRKALKSRVMTTKISEEIDIDEIDCQQAHETYRQKIQNYSKQSNENDEILKEILEEEKQRKQTFQDDQSQKSKKKSNKGKKNKKVKKEDL